LTEISRLAEIKLSFRDRFCSAEREFSVKSQANSGLETDPELSEEVQQLVTHRPFCQDS